MSNEQQTGPIEAWVRTRFDCSMEGSEDVITFARQQDAERAALTAERDAIEKQRDRAVRLREVAFGEVNDARAELVAMTEQRDALVAALLICIDAFRLTREYVGEDLLPNIAGWSHFDAVVQARAALAQVKEIL